MKGVVLAGGLGSRLRPYTLMLPKPLVPVGEWPILEILLRQLGHYGVSEVYVTLGHLGHLIESYLAHSPMAGVGLETRFFHEATPLGTAGALAELKNELTETFIVTNGDVLTSLDIGEFRERHLASGAEVTVAVTRKDVEITLGVLDLAAGDEIVGYREKPVLSYMASMGIYMFEPSALDVLTPGESVDLPDVVKRLIGEGRRVGGYVTDCYWRDIGTTGDYALAAEEFQTLSNEWPWTAGLAAARGGGS